MNLKHFLFDILGMDYGVLHFRHGKHKAFVRTNFEPQSVWVQERGHGHSACCNSPKNWVSYTKVCNGIELFVDVQTDCCRLDWFASDVYHCVSDAE